jgi:hypothetical protein
MSTYCTELQLRTRFTGQIDILNKDFNATNSDFNQVLFAGVKANVELLVFGDIENQRLNIMGNNR